MMNGSSLLKILKKQINKSENIKLVLQQKEVHKGWIKER